MLWVLDYQQRSWVDRAGEVKRFPPNLRVARVSPRPQTRRMQAQSESGEVGYP